MNELQIRRTTYSLLKKKENNLSTSREIKQKKETAIYDDYGLNDSLECKKMTEYNYSSQSVSLVIISHILVIQKKLMVILKINSPLLYLLIILNFFSLKKMKFLKLFL